MKRLHQLHFEQSITGILNGSGQTDILLDCTPGGGKSAIPLEASRLISAGLADKIAWVVPRKSLQDQGERSFQDPFFRDMYRHRYSIRSSTNEVHPSRGTAGFITTYQAIGGDDNRTVLNEVRRNRYVLVLDEFHHLAAGGAWAEAMAPIMEAAAFRILMTGTLSRHDDSPIAFIPYSGSLETGFTPDVPGAIRYTRADALAERAILPLHFHAHDCAVSWKTDSGREVAYASMAKAKMKDAAAAIYTAIDTGFAEELIDEGLNHWRRYRHETWHGSKLLVVCANVGHAKKALGMLQRHGIKSDIATSHDSAAAHRAIKRFRYGKDINVLCGVGMFYEGFDCPAVSHIISLTHIRSVPWIIQMVARAVRIDRASGLPYEAQAGFIFCPDDPIMKRVIAQIRAEQQPVLDSIERERREKEGAPPAQLNLFPDLPTMPRTPGGIIPLASALTGARHQVLGVDVASGRDMTVKGYFSDGKLVGVERVITEKEREDRLRADIDRHVKEYARINRFHPHKINAELYQFFGEKPRENMTRPELERLMAYLQRNYRLDVHRGRSAAVPARAVAV